MQVTKKVSTDFYLKVGSTSNLFNADVTKFNGLLIDETNGTSTTISNPFSEVMKTVDGNTSTLTGDIPAGSKFIPVADGTQFTDGDVLTIGTDYYYIETITGNVLTTKEGSEGHLSGATVTQVGNTGIYKVLMNISTVGLYTAMISNRAVNMQNTPIAIEVVEYSTQDIINKSKQKSFI